jgi:4-amino-4-deoxy-L-arabinose transferase-like glycosyltransferase
MKRLIIILSVATVLRFVAISQPLWYDEAYTALLVKLPFSDMITATVGDVHPPTWYLIERAFTTVLGMNETTLRLPSALLGILAVYIGWRLAKQLNISPTLIAGALAVLPFEIYYSNEARMYSLLTVSVLLATLGVIERKQWLLALGTGLTLLSHNSAIIYIPVLALLAWRKFGVRRAVTAMALGSIPWLIWLPTLFNQARAISGTGYWIRDITGDKAAFLLAQINGMLFPQMTPEWLIPVNVGMTCCLVLFPVIYAVRRRSAVALTLAVLAFVPMLVGLVISVAWQPMMVSRTLAGCLPAWIGLIAWWITQPHKLDMPRSMLVGAACAALLVPSVMYYVSFDRSEGMRAAIDWLASHATPDEVICHADSSSIVLTRFYYSGRTAILVPGSLRTQMSPETMAVTGIHISPPSECRWLIYVRSPLLDKEVMPAVDEVLREHRAEFAHLIFESRAARAEIWRLSNVDAAARVRTD